MGIRICSDGIKIDSLILTILTIKEILHGFLQFRNLTIKIKMWILTIKKIN